MKLTTRDYLIQAAATVGVGAIASYGICTPLQGSTYAVIHTAVYVACLKIFDAMYPKSEKGRQLKGHLVLIPVAALLSAAALKMAGHPLSPKVLVTLVPQMYVTVGLCMLAQAFFSLKKEIAIKKRGTAGPAND